MSLPYPIAASQTDFKSPVDDDLMDSIRLDLNYLDTTTAAIGNYDYQFKLNGPIKDVTLPYKRIDGALVASARTFSAVKLYLEEPGNSGNLEVDVRKYVTPNTLITSISEQYTASISSITRVGSSLNTQSITRATTQISTQSITQFKSSINISSIILLGNGYVRYNLATQPDSDWVVGDSVTTASCTTGANNGNWTIIRVNDDGGNNIIVQNVSGVAQTGAAGTMRLNAWSYNFTNPVDSSFVATEEALFASHTSGGNDGTLTMYAVNSGGNNIITKEQGASGATQAGVAGTVDVLRFKYNLSSAASSSYAVGESILAASHTSSVNDGAALPIKAVNLGGNNVVIYNITGATQGGVAGTINTNRWLYALPSDPTSSFTVGDYSVISSTTSALNSGTFAIKEINNGATNNLVIYNTAGLAQVGAAGTLRHRRLLYNFSSDQSSVYGTTSRIHVYGCVATANNADFDVVQVNRGGGSNYNVVVESASGTAQASPCGRVIMESRSLFSSRPVLTNPTSTTNSTERHMEYTTTATFHSTDAIVASGAILAMDILDIPDGGDPSDVVVQIT